MRRFREWRGGNAVTRRRKDAGELRSLSGRGMQRLRHGA
jgi:hypothetical protein